MSRVDYDKLDQMRPGWLHGDPIPDECYIPDDPAPTTSDVDHARASIDHLVDLFNTRANGLGDPIRLIEGEFVPPESDARNWDKEVLDKHRLTKAWEDIEQSKKKPRATLWASDAISKMKLGDIIGAQKVILDGVMSTANEDSDHVPRIIRDANGHLTLGSLHPDDLAAKRGRLERLAALLHDGLIRMPDWPIPEPQPKLWVSPNDWGAMGIPPRYVRLQVTQNNGIVRGRITAIDERAEPHPQLCMRCGHPRGPIDDVYEHHEFHPKYSCGCDCHGTEELKMLMDDPVREEERSLLEHAMGRMPAGPPASTPSEQPTEAAWTPRANGIHLAHCGPRAVLPRTAGAPQGGPMDRHILGILPTVHLTIDTE
jgi:hypothetical protein